MVHISEVNLSEVCTSCPHEVREHNLYEPGGVFGECMECKKCARLTVEDTVSLSEEPNAEGIEHLGNPQFKAEVERMLRTHVAKAAGYSGQDNPDAWANFREAEAWGLTPLEGCLVRMGDKYRRIQNLRRNPDNDRVGESIKDTLRDLANYAIIAVCLLEEEERRGSQ